MLKDGESLVTEMNRLHQYVSDVLERGKSSGDDRLVLAGVREGRGNVETLAKLGPLGELEQRLQALEKRSDGGDTDDIDPTA